MHMDEVLTYSPISCFKVMSTYQTLITFLRYALPSSLLVAFILVGFYSNQCTLIEFLVILRIVHIIHIIIHHLMGM